MLALPVGGSERPPDAEFGVADRRPAGKVPDHQGQGLSLFESGEVKAILVLACLVSQ